jgi:hypothetical protein
MKWQAKVLILLSIVAMVAGAQSSTNYRGEDQETQVREYWTDPATGLMWAGKDRGRDLNWRNAMQYCRDLRLAGYSGWRLATLAELEGVYDSSASAPGLAGSGKGSAVTWHAKGNLFLTGNQWSSSRMNDDRGHPPGHAWRFDLKGRALGGDELWFYTNKCALCVRGSGE